MGLALSSPTTRMGRAGDHEAAVIRDLNNAWYAKCIEWLKAGLEILDDYTLPKTTRPAAMR